jgi:hypothetical protein
MSDLSYMGGKGYSRGKTGECVNEYTGKANDGALINKGRGPTGGSTKVPNRGKEMYTGTSQVRNPGGTKEFPKRGKSSFDFGRGPTKGNE